MCCCNTVCRFSLIQCIRYKSPIRRHLEELVLPRVILTLLPGRVIDITADFLLIVDGTLDMDISAQVFSFLED